jgi:glycine cleavage system H lipoate-binding protein
MKCPFLRDANVEYCEASAYRKMIAKTVGDAGAERCSSHAYVECPAAAPRIEGLQPSEHCPFLHESHAEFCGAASVTKYIPATNDLLSRCNSDGHFYCELYLAHADPQGDRRPQPHGASRPPQPSGRMPVVDGIPVPQELSYAPNHMWLDVAEDGHCHVGIDGFAAKVLGVVHKITFVTPRGGGRPVAVLRVNGVDLQMVFPNALHVTGANAYLRTTPQKMTADPYGAGWLFETFEPSLAATTTASAREGLIDGRAAVPWMRNELDRLNEFVHDLTAAQHSDGSRFMADGGAVEDGIASRLDADSLINLNTEFFAAQLTWRRVW